MSFSAVGARHPGMSATLSQVRYAMVFQRAGARSQALDASDADFYSMVHWGTDLKAWGKIVAGALVDVADHAALPDGFLLLSVDNADEAERIAQSWPVRDGVTVSLLRVVGNF